ncbi:MAG TPA: hypothetical protein VHX60_05375 [Acidobacteriaceae bacterium]|jgi:hypothetical protein|nr:hypothetical protein [Acidobacteriaceae bacterium]
MARREEWRRILDMEVRRWSSMSCDEVLAELRVRDVYDLTEGSKRYQVEAVLLENTTEYVHVSIAVDDGGLPDSFHPASQGVILRKVVSRNTGV